MPPNPAPKPLAGPLPPDASPAESFGRIRDHFRRLFPDVTESKLLKLIG